MKSDGKLFHLDIPVLLICCDVASPVLVSPVSMTNLMYLCTVSPPVDIILKKDFPPILVDIQIVTIF